MSIFARWLCSGVYATLILGVVGAPSRGSALSGMLIYLSRTGRHEKRREKIARAGRRLARASNVLPAFLVHLCFSLPHGFIQGALQVQKTDAVFSFARVCPSCAFAPVASRAIAASCGDVAGSSLCLVAGP